MTQNPKIYRIDKGNRLLKKLKTTESVIEKIINTSAIANFNPESLKQTTIENVNYFLYIFNINDFVSDWQEFLPTELTEANDFTQQKLSLILFIETEFDIFCIIGGNAYQIILPYIDQSFGLNVYARIMKPESDELASIKSRGITGAIVGENQQFRGKYKIIDYIKFGKIPQEIHLRLSTEISDLHFNFLKNKPNERIQVFVGKAFKIKKGVDFESLHKIINELTIINELVPSDYLSSYQEITDRDFIDNFCKPELMNRIYNDIGNIDNKNLSPHNKFEHEFTNPNNIEKFYEADYYKLKEKDEEKGYSVFKTVSDRTEIYNEVLKRAVERFGDNDPFNFKVFLQGVRVTCYQNNIKKSTVSSGFIFHISTEFPVQGKPIFLIDTKWYLLRDSFINDLKINTEHILKTYATPSNVLSLNWNKNVIKIEKKYNLQYNGIPNYIVVDTIIADGLELCDILKYDDENLYLIHVKYGFSSNMRELTNQVVISAKRLKESLGTEEKTILDKVYSCLVAKQHNIDNLSLQEFKNLFNRKISYVLAFTSHLKEDLKVESNLDKFTSNIARFSLIQCSSDMRTNYYNLLTYQIKRE
ncbi:TIGR04141 family sporadically distributed protein [Flavobacterium franklandianum]|uniref:Sporadically distributed protein, TIGR04141 family n=1 Tax=Flavobacterium franklandianum TaxID=2594430 RepID=A0A553CNQ8_9FLAO|nr:TIGR04141 family sporadically distributed protein [Flavobacterium franklandianum]TRX22041.1 hypothetical protein FNW17_05055 [Flavobacterium franklandianum]